MAYLSSELGYFLLLRYFELEGKMTPKSSCLLISYIPLCTSIRQLRLVERREPWDDYEGPSGYSLVTGSALQEFPYSNK